MWQLPSWKEAKVEKGSSVVVLGLGPVGLGEIQLDDLLTHEIRFEEMKTAYELFKQPGYVKILIKI
ncbi:hypothetical protein CK203_007330 [Vitis vinifera]|uniref:Uncharacterized protein n=1 Tax=Vitis vinifera TaxID=29760 RepID=A0A438G0T0_VITVI|nr:hypothetical protein CK203_007330 [Vitis vinifera]